MGDKRAVSSVLVVDDDPRMLAACKRSLHERRVVAASDAATARELAAREHPEVALIDLRLGQSSGLELVRTLKADHPDLVVALISGWLSVPFAVAAVRAGADLVVSKPFSPKEIVKQIEDGTHTSPDFRETPSLARVEYEYISRVMADSDNNVSVAARRLGIFRQSLQRKLRKQPPL